MGTPDFPVNAFVPKNALIFWLDLACAGRPNFDAREKSGRAPAGRKFTSERPRKNAGRPHPRHLFSRPRPPRLRRIQNSCTRVAGALKPELNSPAEASWKSGDTRGPPAGAAPGPGADAGVFKLRLPPSDGAKASRVGAMAWRRPAPTGGALPPMAAAGVQVGTQKSGHGKVAACARIEGYDSVRTSTGRRPGCASATADCRKRNRSGSAHWRSPAGSCPRNHTSPDRASGARRYRFPPAWCARGS